MPKTGAAAKERSKVEAGHPGLEPGSREPADVINAVAAGAAGEISLRDRYEHVPVRLLRDIPVAQHLEAISRHPHL